MLEGICFLAEAEVRVKGRLDIFDFSIILCYFVFLIGLGIYTSRKIVSSKEFMVAGSKIPGWAAGLSVMCAYVSTLSYIATPGKAYGSNWNVVLFAYMMIPVAFFVCHYIISYYRKIGIVSVYEFLERRLGSWGRNYASITFMLYMVGRVASILYLTGLLLSQFVHIFDSNSANLILTLMVIGVITIIFTLLGGMGAVIWADVLQSAIKIAGILVVSSLLTYKITRGPEPAFTAAWDAGKFSLGNWSWSLNELVANRTVLVMVVFAISENLRNLMADQNYVQKYSACPSDKEAKKSIWVATIVYSFVTTIFVYIGTALWIYYSGSGKGILEAAGITKQDDVFPYFIATELFSGFRGLLIAAIFASAISTTATAFNCCATIWLKDFHQRYINKNITDKQSIYILRLVTVIWGVLGILFATLMLKVTSVLDVWWTMSGIFGGGILGLFLLALFRVKLKMWQGIIAIVGSALFILWGVIVRAGATIPFTETEFPTSIICSLDKIIVGALGTCVLVVIAFLLSLMNKAADFHDADAEFNIAGQKAAK